MTFDTVSMLEKSVFNNLTVVGNYLCIHIIVMLYLETAFII